MEFVIVGIFLPNFEFITDANKFTVLKNSIIVWFPNVPCYKVCMMKNGKTNKVCEGGGDFDLWKKNWKAFWNGVPLISLRHSLITVSPKMPFQMFFSVASATISPPFICCEFGTALVLVVESVEDSFKMFSKWDASSVDGVRRLDDFLWGKCQIREGRVTRNLKNMRKNKKWQTKVFEKPGVWNQKT